MSHRVLGGQFDLGSPSPVPVAASGRQTWARDTGRTVTHPSGLTNVVATPSVTQRIGEAYDQLPHYDEAAVPAFNQLAKETAAQFKFMTTARSRGGMGIHAEVVRHDPYSGPQEMFHDLRENNRIQVYGTGTEESGHHPLMTDEQNDMFRAVHDVFGHAGTGRGFDRHGEEAAYLSHSQMFSGLARRAMATETRGQNSWLVAKGNGNFGPQKVAILPKWARVPVPIIGRRGEMHAAAQQARLANHNQFGGLRPLR